MGVWVEKGAVVHMSWDPTGTWGSAGPPVSPLRGAGWQPESQSTSFAEDGALLLDCEVPQTRPETHGGGGAEHRQKQ